MSRLDNPAIINRFLGITNAGVQPAGQSLGVVPNKLQRTSDIVVISGNDAATVVVTAASSTSFTDDTQILSGSPDTNYSGNAAASIGAAASNIRRAIVRSDLSGVSNNVISAKLQLYDTGPGGKTIEGSFSILRISDANAAWVEATATWNELDTGGTTSWAGSAGLSTAKTDYVNRVLGRGLIRPDVGGYMVDAFTRTTGINLDPLAVNELVLNNTGLLLRSDDEATNGVFTTFSTSEGAGGQAPSLDVCTSSTLAVGTEAVRVVADGAGAYYGAADVGAGSGFPLPAGVPLDVPVTDVDQDGFGLFVPTGVSVAYHGLGNQ